MNIQDILTGLSSLKPAELEQLRAQLDKVAGGGNGIYGLWALFGVFILLPGVLCLVYYHRRLGTRRSLLLQTILSMGLDDAYIRIRHGQKHPEWYAKDPNARIATFENDYFNADFRAGTSWQDYWPPVLVFIVLSSLGWLFVLHRLAPGMSALHVSTAIFPDAWAFGFVGAYLACILTFFDAFRRYDLDPSVYYSASYRLMFASLVAYLVSAILQPNAVPLIAFGIGLFPLQQTWNFITERVAKAAGTTPAEQQLGEELAKIQELEHQHNRQKLLDVGITTIQALATADPLLVFFQTSMPLRTVIDLMDKAILYLYIADKTADLRMHGLNGAIELIALRK
jgi:hypothetical protein